MHAMDISSQAGDTDANCETLDAAVRVDPNNLVVRQKYMIGLEPRWGGSLPQMQDFLEECRRANLPAEHLRRPSDAATLAKRAFAYSKLEDPKALDDFTTAAKLGDAYSQNQLGRYSRNGVPGIVPRDRDQAIKWFQKAAAQGDAEGIKNLSAALGSAPVGVRSRYYSEECNRSPCNRGWQQNGSDWATASQQAGQYRSRSRFSWLVGNPGCVGNVCKRRICP
jgi:TPR repeat protein